MQQYIEQQLADSRPSSPSGGSASLVSIPLAAAILLFGLFGRRAETPLFGLSPAVLGVAVFAIVLATIAFSL